MEALELKPKLEKNGKGHLTKPAEYLLPCVLYGSEIDSTLDCKNQ